MDNHLYIKDVRSSLADISSLEFFVLMGRDVIFCDYFNKFCSLPIFGQRIAYSRKRHKFLFDPPQRRRDKLSVDSVRDWLFHNRFPNFINSRASDEYKLSVLLSYFPLDEKIKQEPPENLSEDYSSYSFFDEFFNEVRQFQMEQFGGVSKMAKFREFVSKSRYGRHVVSFWMDAEQLRHVLRQSKSGDTEDDYHSHRLQLILGGIQTKYYRMTSRFCLPENFLSSGLPDPLKRNCRAYGSDFTLHLQEQVLSRLQEYWLPKYIIHICRRNAIKQADDEEKRLGVCFSKTVFPEFSTSMELMEYARRRSSLVRYLHRYIRSSTEFRMDDSDENILLRNESRVEIWDDPKEQADKMLGADDIDFIHKHLFEDDEAEDIDRPMTKEILKNDSTHEFVIEAQEEEEEESLAVLEKHANKSGKVTFDIDTSECNENVSTITGQSVISSTNDHTLSAATSSLSNTASSCGYEGDSDQENILIKETQIDAKKRKIKHRRKDMSSSGSDSVETISPESFLQKSLTLPIHLHSASSATRVEMKRSASETVQSHSEESLAVQATVLNERISRYRRIHQQNNAGPSVQIQSLFDSPPERIDQEEVDRSDVSPLHRHSSSAKEIIFSESTTHLPNIPEKKYLNKSVSAPNRRSHYTRIRAKKTLSAGNVQLPSVTSVKDTRQINSIASSDSSSFLLTPTSSSSGSKPYFITQPRMYASSGTTTDSSSEPVIPCAGDEIELEEDSEDEEEELEKRDGWQRAFSEILLSDELSGFAYRSFLSKENRQKECEAEEARPDSAFVACFGNVRNRTKSRLTPKNDKEHRRSLVVALDLWRDVEELRRIHGCRQTHEISEKVGAILRTYVYSEVLLNNFEQFADLGRNLALFFHSLALPNEQPFPERLLNLQKELQMVLETNWIVFATADREKFQTIVLPMDWKIGIKINSFPTCSSEIRTVPFLGYLSNPNATMTDPREAGTSEDVCTLSNFLGYNGQGQSAYRASRAVHLLLMSARAATQAVGGFYSNDYDGQIGAEVDSDDDGGMPPLPQKRYTIFPDIDTKLLSQMSAKEYPGHIGGCNKSKFVREVQRHRVVHRPVYLRPIRKKGNVFQRPSKRPKNLLEVLRDPLHTMFFKRYMRLKNSEAPLLFWKTVDLLKRTEKVSTRHRKAKAIMKKFFGRLAGGGILLQCDDDLIKDLSQVQNVTTSMLVEAQALVYASMEKNWGQKYASTFPEDPEEEREIVDKTHSASSLSKSRSWKVFSDFIRRAANFIRNMKNPERYREFRQFLVMVSVRVDDRAAGDASSKSSLIQETIYMQQNVVMENKITNRKVLGRKIVLEFLPNDLSLWLEVDRFQLLLQNENMLMMTGCHSECDSDIVHGKARTIIECFFDSSIPPKLRVNVDLNSAQTTLTAYAAGGINRPLFHKAVLCIFPLLLHYWRIFCLKKYCYVSKKTLRALGRVKVIRNRIEIEKRRRSRHIPSPQKFPEITESEMQIPDYVNSLVRMKSPYDRVKGIVVDDPPILHFSMQHGIKFIIPPKRVLHDGIKGNEDSEEIDEDEFLSVWTRGGKMVNVIRRGSNPQLLSLKKPSSDRTVECDLFED